MNRRQWKKDKIAKEFITAYTALDLPKEIAKMLAAAGDTIADVLDGLSKSMRAAAEYYRDMGEGNNGKNSMQGVEERRSKAQRTGNA